MDWVNFIALLAIIQYLYFGWKVAEARGRFGIKAPATTGHEEFERIYRVQVNTMESLVAFLPALYIAAHYWSNALAGLIGLAYLFGRLLYGRGYVIDASLRSRGFMLSIASIAVLLLMGLLGAIF